MTRLPLILLVLISSLVAASAQTTPAGALPQLRYGGALSSGAPYTFHDPGDPNKIIGFEVDIMNTLAERLGYRPVFVNNDWASLIPGLDTGLYDLVINGLEITSAHQAAADFSIPYYITFGQIVIRRGDPPVENLAALKGKRVGTLQASQMDYVLRAAGNIDVRVYDEEIDVYSDLKLGRIDASVMDFPIAVYYAKPDRALEFTGEPIGRIEYGIALKKGVHPDLLANINSALATMLSDGTMHRILDRWALWTPMMAQATGDTRSMLAQPIDYDRFVEATEPTTWRGQFERYMRFLPQLGWAAVATVQISVLSMVLAVAFGVVLALCRVYGGVVLDRIAQVYIETIRGTPLLIQLLFIYYGLPKIGLQLDPYVAGVLALGLNYAAYEAENYRAGLLAVPRHQMEAAIALNMTGRQSLRYVVVPQAARIVVPPTTNDFISLLKDSSLVSVISLVELTKTYELLSTTYYDYFGTGLLVGAIYLLLGLPFVRLARWAERHLSRGMTRASS